MAERPVSPPPAKAVTELRTPNCNDGFLTLLVGRQSDFYQNNYPLQRGKPYAGFANMDERVVTEFSANPLYALKELRPGNSAAADFGTSDLFVIWVFATKQIAQSNYNAAIEYPGENTGVARYSRDYEVKRQDYEANPTIAYLSPLTAMISVNVTAGGTGYTQATGVIATGAKVSFVCYGGAIIDGIVTAEGSGVADGGSITITGNGTGGAAVARIQPADALLIHQEKREYPDENPRSHDYVQVLRVYEQFPGPWIPFSRWDLRLGPIQGRRRAVLNTGQVATETATTKTTYEGREGSSIVSWQIEETNSNGSGSGPDNPTFPILVEDLYDDNRGAVQRATQTVVATGSETASLTESGGVVTKITYEAINQYLLSKSTETWTLPGPLLDGGSKPDDRAKIFVTRTKQLKVLASITDSYSIGSGPTAVTVHREDYDLVSAFEVTETIPDSPFNGTGVTPYLEETFTAPYQFPGYIYCYGDYGGMTYTGPDFFGANMGTKQANSQNAIHFKRTYWVISNTKPDIDPLVDEITPGDVVLTLAIDGTSQVYRNMLFDSLNRVVQGGWGIKNIPATVPTFTEYFGTNAGSVSGGSPPATPFPVPNGSGWIGNEHTIKGEVTEDGHPSRWKVELISLIMQ